jgi:hypothetical protein
MSDDDSNSDDNWELPARKPREPKPPPKASWESSRPASGIHLPGSASPFPISGPEIGNGEAEPESGIPDSGSASPLPISAAAADDPLAPLPAAATFSTPTRRPPTPLPFPPDDGDDDLPPRGGGKRWIAVALITLVGLAIGALVFLGARNQERFVLTCDPGEASAGQGRGFPPWGTRTLDDDGKWKPIPITPETLCTDLATDDEAALSAAYLDLLYARARALLTAREVTKVDDAAALLQQALLHARDGSRSAQRKLVESLLGDVEYWRASAKLREATAALTDAAKQFDAAAAQHPLAVSNAAAWALHIRRLVEELRGGPSKTPTAAFPPSPPLPERPTPPAGVALPVEPATTPPPAAPPAAPPDAGVPGGGILL